jgi:hypothetical protein
MPKMMGFELSLKKICAQRETTGVFGHDPDNLHRAQRNGEQVSRLLEMKDGPIIHAIVFRQRLRARSSRL